MADGPRSSAAGCFAALNSASAQPSAAVPAANIPNPENPPAAISEPPTEPAINQPRLAMVMFRPKSALRISLGTSASVVINDGRPAAFTRE